MRALRVLLATAALGTLVSSPRAWACSCIYEPGPTPVHEVLEEYFGWEVSFIGVAQARQDLPEQDLTRWALDVEGTITGHPTDPQDVLTRYEPPGYVDTCNHHLQVRRRYRIGADRQPDGTILLASICSSTADPIP